MWFTDLAEHIGVACALLEIFAIEIPPIQRQKTYFGHVRQAKIQISLRIRAIWSESSMRILDSQGYKV